MWIGLLGIFAKHHCAWINTAVSAWESCRLSIAAAQPAGTCTGAALKNGVIFTILWKSARLILREWREVDDLKGDEVGDVAYAYSVYGQTKYVRRRASASLS